MSDLPQEVAPLADEGIYPIREVSRLTGVNAVTLRAWQRRYGLVQPARTERATAFTASRISARSARS